MDLPLFPARLRSVIAHLPAYPPAVITAVALNLWLSETLNARNLPSARGKVIAIAVRDVGLQLAVELTDEGPVARGATRPDVTIRADARDFLALARREADPDTLFFSRRLVIEGDTELGLLVKNTLDSIDLRTLRLPSPPRVLAALALQLRALAQAVHDPLVQRSTGWPERSREPCRRNRSKPKMPSPGSRCSGD